MGDAISDPIPDEQHVDAVEENRPVALPKRNRFYRAIGLAFLVIALLAIFYGTVAYLGWQSGQDIRVERASAGLADSINRQIELAHEDIEIGNYNLAMTRLDWVLARQPGHNEASVLRGEAAALLDARLNPTPIPTASPTSLPPTITPIATLNPAEDFADLEALFEDEQWEEAVAAILEFQATNPSYRRRDTDEMLFASYLTLGVDRLNGEAVETGIYYLTLAEQLGDLPIDVQDQRSWAELYLTGIAFYEVDWGATVYYFRDLCLSAPFYKESCVTFEEALINYADLLADSGELCPAEIYYREARFYNDSDELVEKLVLATEGCLAATPTPEVISGTIGITNTTTITNP